MMLPTAWKRALWGTDPRPTRIRRGLARGIVMELDRATSLRMIMGIYEPAIQPSLRRMVSGARTCYDVGSHNGFFSLLFAAQPGMELVHAFEPDPFQNSRFRRNMDLNPSLAPRIHLHPVPVGPSGGATSLDALMEQEGMPLPDVIKIDVDGPEIGILGGAESLLRAKKTFWVVETHDRAKEQRTYEILKSMGYTVAIPKLPWWCALFPELRPSESNRHVIAWP